MNQEAAMWGTLKLLSNIASLLKAIAANQQTEIKLLKAIRFRTSTAAFISLVVLEQLDMARFKFGIKVTAQDDDAVKASVQATLPSGESFTGEADLVESTDGAGVVTKSALVTAENFIGGKGDLVQLKAKLFDEDGNPSPEVEDVGVIRDTIGPQAPVMSIVTLEQVP